MPIALWAAKLNRPLTEREEEILLRLLPRERRDRLFRVRQRERRREPLCAYFILRRALWEQYRWREIPEIARSSAGKPFFPAHPEAHFSLSHTHGAVLVGLSGQPLGVDIERIRPVDRRMETRFSEADPGGFFRTWVRREARGKRTGIGIGGMLQGEPPLEPGEFYHEADIFPGYAAGASGGDGEPPEVVRRLVLGRPL